MRAAGKLLGLRSLNILEVADAEADRDDAFAKALAAPDKALNFRIFDWFMAQHKTDQLLNVCDLVLSIRLHRSADSSIVIIQIRSHFLQEYLLGDKSDLEKYDLLWQYYVRNRNYYEAAYVLSELADSSE